MAIVGEKDTKCYICGEERYPFYYVFYWKNTPEKQQATLCLRCYKYLNNEIKHKKELEREKEKVNGR